MDRYFIGASLDLKSPLFAGACERQSVTQRWQSEVNRPVRSSKQGKTKAASTTCYQESVITFYASCINRLGGKMWPARRACGGSERIDQHEMCRHRLPTSPTPNTNQASPSRRSTPCDCYRTRCRIRPIEFVPNVEFTWQIRRGFMPVLLWRLMRLMMGIKSQCINLSVEVQQLMMQRKIPQPKLNDLIVVGPKI